MGIIRIEKNTNYVVMAKHGLQDDRLSWKAKGILAYMLSMPDDWVFYTEELETHAKDGIDGLRSGLRELKECGYINRYPVKDPETGRIASWETVLYEIPQTDPHMDLPHMEKPVTGESNATKYLYLLNTELTNTPVRGDKLPEIQKPTALIFLQQTGKEDLTEDDVTCLNLLFKIHTPTAIQKQIMDSVKRLEKNGSAKSGDEVITEKSDLPMRYIYDSMKNWSSLRRGNSGAHRGNRGNVDRENKDYEKGGDGLFAKG
jgi:hypothetical protein